jgi:peptide methionine sulfoxide reductase msrA/msrB
MNRMSVSRTWKAALVALVAMGAACRSQAQEPTGEKPAPTPWTSAKSFKKPSEQELHQRLTARQFDVTQHEGTEPPFHNEYWDNHSAGIYVDVVSGEPLFSSTDKFESGTGWPSFTKPLSPDAVSYKSDTSLFAERTEVRSKLADSHLGHVFDDGPEPTGKRYCMNSAAMRFIPVDQLAAMGYGQYLPLFGKPAAGASDAKPAPKTEIATLAGGCFWGMQEIIRHLPGVVSSVVGYTGGSFVNPTYEDVHTGTTGDAESVQVTFDPSKITYEQLLGYFFRMHDPTYLNRQGNDVGTQYRSAIFYHSEEQRKIAEKVKAQVDKSGKWPRPVVTEIVPANTFYPAEDYHQDYLQKNPGGYTCHYMRD